MLSVSLSGVQPFRVSVGQLVVEIWVPRQCQGLQPGTLAAAGDRAGRKVGHISPLPCNCWACFTLEDTAPEDRGHLGK